MVFRYFFSRTIADHGNPGTTQITGILIGGEECVEKCIHPVRTGKNNPIITPHIGQCLDESGLLLRWFDPNGG